MAPEAELITLPLDSLLQLLTGNFSTVLFLPALEILFLAEESLVRLQDPLAAVRALEPGVPVKHKLDLPLVRGERELCLKNIACLGTGKLMHRADLSGQNFFKLIILDFGSGNHMMNLKSAVIAVILKEIVIELLSANRALQALLFLFFLSHFSSSSRPAGYMFSKS